MIHTPMTLFTKIRGSSWEPDPDVKLKVTYDFYVIISCRTVRFGNPKNADLLAAH